MQQLIETVFSLSKDIRYVAVYSDVNFHFNLVDVRDVAAGMIATAEKGRAGERYMLATEHPVSTRRIIELAQEFNPSVKIPHRASRWMLMITAALMELGSKITGKAPMMMRNQVALYYGVELQMNISKARQELGFTPRDPETAIREAFDYLASSSQ